MSKKRVNVSVEELDRFAEYVSSFSKCITMDCDNLQRAFLKLSNTMDEESITAIHKCIDNVQELLMEHQTELIELENKVKQYAEFVRKLKGIATDNESTLVNTLRSQKGQNVLGHAGAIAYEVLENAAGVSDPTGTVGDAFVDLVKMGVPIASEKGPSLAENMHQQFDTESDKFYQTHFMRDSNGVPITPQQAKQISFAKNNNEY